ncbi:MAG TPA: hypothetical protein VM925_29680 [Labilithrix sp.]|nr:hypothetical protein [Labilithrix sp.]
MRPFARTRGRRLLRPMWLVALTVLTSPVLADDGEAERLFRDGRALMLESRFSEACPKLAESQRLEPRVGTLLNLAACHERQGKVASAWDEFQKAATTARAEGQIERARLAEQQIALLQPRVPWLRISVPAGAGELEVTLDGKEVEPFAFGTEIPVDPGAHVVRAEVRRARVFETQIELQETERRTIALDRVTPNTVDSVTGDGRSVTDAPSSPASVDPAGAAPGRTIAGRWILEAGAFGAFVDGTTHAPEPVNGSNPTPPIEGRYWRPAATATFAVGIKAFAGYAFSERFAGGVRALAGPTLASGSVMAIGPSIAFRIVRPLTIGLWGAAGSAWFTGVSDNSYSSHEGVERVLTAVKGGISFAVGAGLEVAFRVVQIGRGLLVVNAVPFFLTGETGYAVALPIGLAYRYQ